MASWTAFGNHSPEFPLCWAWALRISVCEDWTTAVIGAHEVKETAASWGRPPLVRITPAI